MKSVGWGHKYKLFIKGSRVDSHSPPQNGDRLPGSLGSGEGGLFDYAPHFIGAEFTLSDIEELEVVSYAWRGI
jgi:hypothetical protein